MISGSSPGVVSEAHGPEVDVHARHSRIASAPAWPDRLAALVATYAVAGGTVTLIGWATDVERLTDWKADGISMFPNTAVCAVLSGLAILLMGVRRPAAHIAARCFAVVVAVIGGLTLFEHLSGIDLGIDTLLFARPWGQFAAAAPSRMGPPASASFLALGTALVLLTSAVLGRGASAGLGVAVGAIALLSVTGHLYGAHQMYMIPRLTAIAFQTATMLLALAIGVVARARDREPMRTLVEDGAAGILARRALPIIVALALTLGWLRVMVQRAGLVDLEFGTAMRTLLEIALLIGVLWRASRMLRTHERALRDSEAEVRRQAGQLAAFLDTAAIALHRVGPDGTILWANDAELEMLGYAREEYVGRHIAEFHVDQDAIADSLSSLRCGETLLEHPGRMRCKDGSIKHVLVDSSVLWDEGRFVHTQCFTRDVTERRKAEETRALLAAIIEASDDAIISTALDGTITSWNAGAERMFGHSAREVLGRPIDVIIPPERVEADRETRDRLSLGVRSESYETVRRAKDGRLIDVSITISPVRDGSGRTIGTSKIARDVTDRKRAEAEREEGNRRKDEFIAILAHELRNPLAPVRSAARYLAMKAPADSDLKRPVEMIERQVAQMSRLIDDLLDVSRMSRGMLELRRERVACAEIVDAAVDACRDDLQAKGHVLRVHVAPEPIEVEADRERLVQILCNLIGNGIKYTPAGGQIDLTVAVAAGQMLDISVKDNGIGIPPARLGEIFDLFARIDPSFERQGGLGIGLTLVRQLVELHGGTIEARSDGVGHGSEFLLKLPVVAVAAAPAPAVPEPGPASGPLRILVADDNHDAAESLALILRLTGHDVEVAFDGEAAVASFEARVPHLALLDIGMPKANGYEVARRIRAHPSGKETYLVALTGWGHDEDRRRAEAAGFDEHLVKPVNPQTLDQLVVTIGAASDAASRGSGAA
jgi:PAS domain S-box-containing protein